MDGVINHMSGWWPDGTQASGGSSFNAGNQDYPGVPYSSLDFNDANCYTASGNIEDYGNAEQVSSKYIEVMYIIISKGIHFRESS